MSRRHDWSYGNFNGPDTWADYFPCAKGQSQSPIELHTRYIKHDVSLRPWTFSYRAASSMTIANDGTTVRVMFDGSSGYVPTIRKSGVWNAARKPASHNEESLIFSSLVIKDGPLTGSYRLRQLQLHWGSSDDQGSEHVIDGLKYAGELQFVHWNSKYDNVTEAKKNPDGVAIIADIVPVYQIKGISKLFKLCLPKVQCFCDSLTSPPSERQFNALLMSVASLLANVGKVNQQLKAIIEALDCIKAKGRKAHFTDFDPSILFPTSRDYWTYQGSYTTPPCEECVTWILLREPITASAEQMEKLRSILSTMECEAPVQMANNYRPTQPLNGRE
ncbi:unnamed protein product, partial [Ranitomeya imitator]